MELLRNRGAQVRAMDAQPVSTEEREVFARWGVPVVAQQAENVAEDGRDPDAIVLSPGVPYDLPLLAEARGRSIPVVGEVELASYFLKGPIIGITGSNGKTTTTALTGHILTECGIACQVAGNIGVAIASRVDSSRQDQWNVLELSSFQLESISHFRANISACLNVTPDHLDRHHTFEQYAAAKARLFETQQAGDLAVLNRDDATCYEFAKRTKAEVFWFSSSRKVTPGIWCSEQMVCWNDEPFLHRSQIKLRGAHNVENVLAAALMAHLAGAPLAGIERAVGSFAGVEHRLEFVRTLDGVDYFNDSKATNVDAALKAIEAFPSGLWVILGGKDKGSDYEPLREPLHARAKAALLIGAPPPYEHAAAPLIEKALAGAVTLVECGTLEQAVHHAREHAKAGDTVLLAPACASFDQFCDYEERGRRFKELVKELS